MEFKFKRDNPDASQRRKDCDKIRGQFPEKIPIICERDPKSNIKDIDKTKYLVPADQTGSHFNCMIRKRIEIEKEETFFCQLMAKNK